jgi:hypothetical protein
MEKIVLSKKDIFEMLKKKLSDDMSSISKLLEQEISKNFSTIVTLSTSDKQILSKLLYNFRTKWKQCQKEDFTKNMIS